MVVVDVADHDINDCLDSSGGGGLELEILFIYFVTN